MLTSIVVGWICISAVYASKFVLHLAISGLLELGLLGQINSILRKEEALY